MSAFPQKPRQSFADLRPNMPIWCMFGHQASSDGALRFRSHLVCAACAAKIKAKPIS